MTELQPCPICKGTRICMDGGDNTYHPRCLDCGCTAPFDAWQSRTPAPAEVERLVDRINDELFCGALKGETKSLLLAALTNTTPYLSEDVNVERKEWTAWLIEDNHKSGSIRYMTMEQGMFNWTTDPLKALHFCRREDAEKVAQECDDAEYIREHLFYSGKDRKAGE